MLLTVALLFFMLKGKKKTVEVAPAAAKIAAADAAKPSIESQASIASAEKVGQVAARAAEQLQIPEKASEMETLRQNVRASVTRDPALAAGVIRSWISEPEN